ncbi:globin domain-containing protein [Streptomyces sp. HSG2]|uniref:globin domain-containing protein n=1 Tax=Streptomyces sp. HSG2 TaxID=2797167 RepID=UPI0019079274|nr:globin domain-containing protein [Streptomyces sp. HSG2]
MSASDYHTLLARQEAMRLRQSLLSTSSSRTPGGRPGPRSAGAEMVDPYRDGRHDSVHDQRVITRDLPLVLPLDRLIAHLYDAMFERHPYLRALFPDSMLFQRAHLEKAFCHLVENLHRPELIAEHGAALGREHRRLGIRPAHLAVFEEALAEGLRRSAEAAWTRELEDAWLRMLRCCVAAMVSGAEAATGEPAYWNAEVIDHRITRAGNGAAVGVLRVRPGEPYTYRAGQYASLQSPLLPQAWRPYVVAGAPRPDGELEFHVRVTGPGGVSEALAARTGVGDTLRLGPARGAMTLDDADLTARDVLIVASGTGWATAKALLRDLADRRPRGRGAHLVLADVRSRADLYDPQGLEWLEARCPWLRVSLTPPGTAPPIAGPMERTAFVCGPPPMVDSAVRALVEGGLPAHLVRRDPPSPSRT